MNKFSDFISSKKFTVIASFLGLYLLSTGSSWAVFTYLKGGEEPSTPKSVEETRKTKIDPSLPKTEACPINGKLYSKPERQIWETRRPITAVIENHADARPQSGISSADVVYEIVAEGGITRFLTIFYCGASADDVKISPVRSARVYLVDWASEYGKNPIFVHVGGANNICPKCPGGIKPSGDIAKEVDAFKLLEKLGWRGAKGNDFDGGTNVGVPAITRDQYRLGAKAAWEHSVVGFTDKIFEEGQKRGFSFKDDKGNSWEKDFVSWKFSDEKALSSPKAGDISFGFWDNKGDYDVSWKYDKGTNSYLRFNGGKEHVDHETNKQISVKNVVIQFVNEKGPVDKEGHMFYTTVGKGDIIVFQNGDVVKGTWRKDQSGRTKFFDSEGKEIQFVRGLIWIEGVPTGNKIDYK